MLFFLNIYILWFRREFKLNAALRWGALANSEFWWPGYGPTGGRSPPSDGGNNGLAAAKRSFSISASWSLLALALRFWNQIFTWNITKYRTINNPYIFLITNIFLLIYHFYTQLARPLVQRIFTHLNSKFIIIIIKTRPLNSKRKTKTIRLKRAKMNSSNCNNNEQQFTVCLIIFDIPAS